MKRQTSQKLGVRRREAALVAEHERDPHRHKLPREKSEQANPRAPGGADGAPAGFVKLAQVRGASAQAATGESRHAANNRATIVRTQTQTGSRSLDTPSQSFDALKGPLGASWRIIVELCVSHYSIRAFSDFPKYAGEATELENHARGTTQVIARQSEAARSDGSWWRCRRLKICASAHIPDR